MSVPSSCIKFKDGVDNAGLLELEQSLYDRLSAGELGDGLGTLRDGMLGELSWENQSDGGLDLSGTEYSLVVVSNKATSLRSDSLEGIVNQRVQDGN